MSIPQEVLNLEKKKQFAEAYRILEQMWQDGDKDRDLGLHLIFLAWYGLIEPGHLTGFLETDEVRQELEQMLTKIHAYFEFQILQDAEMLYVVGLIAHLYWFMLDEKEIWEKRSIEYRKHYRFLCPGGITPSIFLNRGGYGDYFYRQANVVNGY